MLLGLSAPVLSAISAVHPLPSVRNPRLTPTDWARENDFFWAGFEPPHIVCSKGLPQ